MGAAGRQAAAGGSAVMRAALLPRFGGPEALQVVSDAPVPALQAEEARALPHCRQHPA